MKSSPLSDYFGLANAMRKCTVADTFPERKFTALHAQWKFLMLQLNQCSTVLAGLTVFLLSLITSSFVSWWLYKSVIAIFDSIIIIMINDYEYCSIVSIYLSRRVHQDKNKDCDCVKTIQEPATEAHFSADLNPLFRALPRVRNLTRRLCALGFTWWFLNNYLYFGKLKAWLPQKER